MPTSEYGLLRLESTGGWPVAETIAFLQAVETTYDGLLVFETLLENYRDQVVRTRSLVRYGEFISNREFGLSITSLIALPDTALAQLIEPHDGLVLQRVQLNSPGFWEFLGNQNPLEVLRKYLDDRHRRRQDRGYREFEERRQLQLENTLREIDVIERLISVAREAGITDAELALLRNRLIYTPFKQLDAINDRGMIRTSLESAGDEPVPEGER